MLGLKLETDPFWVKNVVEKNIPEILTDHAWCEQKAASTAISLIVSYCGKEDLVQAMTELAREELSHFQLVTDIIKKRGFELGAERKDDYVGQLRKFVRNGVSYEDHMIDRLLFSAMIEARSCERFRVLAENIGDTELAEFYRGLMASEARHYTLFLKLAKKYCTPEKVDERWKEWIEFEAGLIKNYGKSETVHG
jgi:tRNA-(ms[2]io[6]A)-hydroxylase